MEIEVRIYDRNHPQGLMGSLQKKKFLKRALFEMMYRDLMSDADISPKFNGADMEDGVYVLKAVNKHSVDCLIDIVKRMPPPWPNANLYVQVDDSEPISEPKNIVVEAYVPEAVVDLEEVLYRIAEFDRRIGTNQWKTLGSRPLGVGTVFTFTITDTDFDVLNTYDGFVPFHGNQIEFRVLKKPELIPNVM